MSQFLVYAFFSDVSNKNPSKNEEKNHQDLKKASEDSESNELQGHRTAFFSRGEKNRNGEQRAC